MLCDKCKEKEATIHITKYVDGEKSEVYLCEQCAKETGHIDDNDVFSFKNLIAGILNPNVEDYEEKSTKGLKCDNCGLTYEEFRREGRVGCPECYNTFEDKLRPLIKRIQGSEKHVGKIPKDKDKYLRVKRDIQELKEEMEKVVADENFERAAEIRDEIYALEQKIGSE
ncbi:MAG TPA: UvrB/UvrC motif-containing protein [Halanaerobiales bacterium]|nr:UvrB/UvrC motif-containing protein [Halanaerobiales bacterium]